ncbi:hypothetical protein ACFQ9X_22600 [Catenulispora yoronensis]
MFGWAAANESAAGSRAGMRFDGLDTGPDAQPVDSRKAIAAIGATLPVRSAAVVMSQDFNGFVPIRVVVKRTPGNDCPFFGANSAPISAGADGESMIQADPRCTAAFSGGQVVPGDAATLRALTGTVDPAAEKVLAEGGMVVFNRYDLDGFDPVTGQGKATVALQRSCPPDGADMPEELRKQFGPYCSGPAPADTTLPAAVASAKDHSAVSGVRALIPQAVADKYGAKYVPSMILFDTTRMPTRAEEERANAAAESLGTTALLKVERGYQGGEDTAMLALAAVAAFVTLGAAAIATGLAITDSEADLETLAAVGARRGAADVGGITGHDHGCAGYGIGVGDRTRARGGDHRGAVPQFRAVGRRCARRFPGGVARGARTELPGDPVVVPDRHRGGRAGARGDRGGLGHSIKG